MAGHGPRRRGRGGQRATGQGCSRAWSPASHVEREGEREQIDDPGPFREALPRTRTRLSSTCSVPPVLRAFPFSCPGLEIIAGCSGTCPIALLFGMRCGGGERSGGIQFLCSTERESAIWSVPTTFLLTLSGSFWEFSEIMPASLFWLVFSCKRSVSMLIRTRLRPRTALLAFPSFCVFLRAQQKQTRISAYAYSHYFPLSGI